MIMKNDDVIQEFSVLCRQVGLKLTAPRLAVYQYLKDNVEHPGVDKTLAEVRKKIPTISRESVYRVLNDFAAHGIIALLDRPDVVARYDANPSRHDHFYCERCGRFFDFEIKDLPTLIDESVRPFGVVERAEIRVRGVCHECLAKEKKST